MSSIRTLEWTGDSLVLIDQTQLPLAEVKVTCSSTNELISAINRLVVRGAPALGAVGAFGVALAMIESSRENWTDERRAEAISAIRGARPTAVNLAWGVDHAVARMDGGLIAVIDCAKKIVREDLESSKKLSIFGADFVLQKIMRRPIRVLTHCNAGALATTGWGTALGVVRELHARELVEIVYVDETRPLLQGTRLTSWELARFEIDHVIQTDSAAASTILRGLVDFAVIGADRIALNGDTANKIGSLGVALACREAGIPFIVAAPSSTIDPNMFNGDEIPIELRDPSEVLTIGDVSWEAPFVGGFNPAFDVTPARLITAIVTENGVFEPDKISMSLQTMER